MKPPVAIGGLGGSGTRVVASIVRNLGYDLGPDLNESLDNLTFTVLFKRPKRFTYRNGLVDPSDRNAQRATSVFCNLMSPGKSSASDLAYFLFAAGDVAVHGHDYRHSGRGTWAVRRLRAATRNAKHRQAAWGWKEPNSYIFLPALYKGIPDLVYIHVIRDGLDMAYSSNLAQLHNWAHLFNVNSPTAEPALRQLEFWARANATVTGYLAENHPGKYCIVRYEDVVSEPVQAIQPFLRMLGHEEEGEDLVQEVLAAAPLSPSSSVGRHKDHDVSALLGRTGSDVRDSLAQFGYEN